MGDWQFIVVVIVFAVAAVYAGRVFMRQFWQSEDEGGGCASCPGNDPTPKTPSPAASELSKASRKSE
jgi:hypothetical protein